MDHDLFQVSDIAPHIAPVGLEVKYWVSDELSGPVISNIPAPTSVNDVDGLGAKRGAVGQDVVVAVARAGSARNDMRMLKQ